MGFVGTAGRKTRETDYRYAGGAQDQNTSPFSSLTHDRLADRNHDRSISAGRSPFTCSQSRFGSSGKPVMDQFELQGGRDSFPNTSYSVCQDRKGTCGSEPK